MIDVTDLRKGMHVIIDGKIYTVVDFEMHKMGRGHSAVVRTRIKDVLTGLVQDKTFKSGDQIEEATLTLKASQYLYKDDNFAYFMANDNYEQYSLPLADLEDEIKYMKENMEVNLLFHDENVIGVLLPTTVVLEIVETDPGFKGDTVAGSGKPAILETGLKINIPFFVNKGEKVKIDTRTGDYIERA